MAFPFLQRANLGELARQFKLAQYAPSLTLERLTPGVDNVRHDVALSQPFCKKARSHIARMHAKHGQVEDLVREGSQTTTAFRPATFAPPAHPGKQAPPKPEADFKSMLADLLTTGLNRAKAEGNINIDLLLRLAVLKFLRTELLTQFNAILDRCREKAKSLENPRGGFQDKALEARERVARFQINKKHILRKTGQDLFETLREVEKETLARMRRSLVGDEAAASYELFLNRLLFTEDGKDDYLNAEHYVMTGNYERDPDRVSRIISIASGFLETLDALSLAGEYATYDAILSAPENAQELMAGGSPDENTAKGKAQKQLLQAWTEALEREGVLERIAASYEVVPLLVTYWPHVHAQQLKDALLLKDQYQRVIGLLDTHGKLSPDALNQAIKRLQGYKPQDRAKMAGRFLLDFTRYRRDMKRMEAVLAACDKVNVVATEKLRELSQINNTLYEFLLADEQKTGEEKVLCHAVLKSDIRDSTGLTRTMLERGLNPASYFSLNVYEPVNRIIANHGATKVFIEGDAIILALFDHDSEPGFCVARSCVVARDMIQVVHAYNQKSQAAGLPLLELGIGISFQDSAPMYLMDGNTRIMISDAINVSDRLSGCTKGAKKFVTTHTPFSAFAFQTVDESVMGSSLDEFLIRYNVGGIVLNQLAFDKLTKEISLEVTETEFPMLWGPETVKVYSGLVPMAQGSFHTIHVREVPVALVDAGTHELKRWTSLRFYEVITNQSVCEQIESRAQAARA